MGRWAQAKRRGAAGPKTPPLVPPPVPSLSIIDGYLRQTAAGGDDTGGKVHLFRAAGEGGPFLSYGVADWALVYPWGQEETLSGWWYTASEEGNNTVYAGLSEQCAPFLVGEP